MFCPIESISSLTIRRVLIRWGKLEITEEKLLFRHVETEVTSMNQRLILVFTSIFILSFSPLSVQAQELPLNTCQQIKDRIEHYNDLRKHGGSAQQMERWKIYRKKAKNEFRDNKCSKWKKNLK